MCDARFAADISASIAGSKGNFAAFVLVAEIPALLRGGAFEALRERLGFPRDILALGFRGVGISPEVHKTGH